MKSLTESQFKEIANWGREFAYEGMDPSTFKSDDPEELEAFAQGYTEGHLIGSSLKDEEKFQKAINALHERIDVLKNKNHSMK